MSKKISTFGAAALLGLAANTANANQEVNTAAAENNGTDPSALVQDAKIDIYNGVESALESKREVALNQFKTTGKYEGDMDYFEDGEGLTEMEGTEVQIIALGSNNNMHITAQGEENSLSVGLEKYNDYEILSVEVTHIANNHGALLTLEKGGDIQTIFVTGVYNGDSISTAFTGGMLEKEVEGKTVKQLFAGMKVTAQLSSNQNIGLYATHTNTDTVLLNTYTEETEQDGGTLYETYEKRFTGTGKQTVGVDYGVVLDDRNRLTANIGYTKQEESGVNFGTTFEHLNQKGDMKTTLQGTVDNYAKNTNYIVSAAFAKKISDSTEASAFVKHSKFNGETDNAIGIKFTFNFDGGNNSNRFASFTPGTHMQSVVPVVGATEASRNLYGKVENVKVAERFEKDSDVDTIAPVIKYDGGTITMFVGDTFVEPEISALDETDGIVPVTKISSDLDTTKPGTYTIVYGARDTAGNPEELHVTVVVQEKPKTDAETIEAKPEVMSTSYNSVQVTDSMSDSDGYETVAFVLSDEQGNEVARNTTGVFTGLEAETLYKMKTVGTAVNGKTGATVDVESESTTFTTGEKPNEAPTQINISSNSVVENAPANTLVGTLSCVDPEGQSCTYTVKNGAFTIIGDKLYTTQSFDYEDSATQQAEIVANDGVKTKTQILTINILNESGPSAPTVTTSVDGKTVTLTASATDAETYSFSVNGVEVYTGSNNTYTYTDTTASGTQNYSVTATNTEGTSSAATGSYEIANEAPTLNSVSVDSISLYASPNSENTYSIQSGSTRDLTFTIDATDSEGDVVNIVVDGVVYSGTSHTISINLPRANTLADAEKYVVGVAYLNADGEYVHGQKQDVIIYGR